VKKRRALRVCEALLAMLLGCDPASQPSAAPSPSAPASAPLSASSSAGATPSASATPKEDHWLADRLSADPRLKDALNRARELRLQILVSVPDGNGKLTSHGFRVDAEYFYPASAIKTFLAVAALHALPRFEKPIDAHTSIRRCLTDSGRCEKYKEDADEKDEDGTFTVAGEIQKLLSYSDNDSYERLFDLVGHRDVNETIARLGFKSVRIHHRMGAPAEKSRRSPRLIVQGATIAPRESTLELAPTPAAELSIGKAYRDGKGKVEEPLSFATKNYVSLRELQLINVSLLMPKAEQAIDLRLDEKQRAILVKPMTGRLRPRSEAERHKPLLPGVLRVVPEKHLLYIDKSGRAYGFHLENAYIEDTRSKRGFFVTVTIYVNSDGVLNDDVYDYDEVSVPFMDALGEVLARNLLKD